MLKIKIDRDKSLSLSDDVIFSWIKQEDVFDLTNEKMAAHLGVSVSLITQSLRRLRSINRVYNESFNGHRRILKARNK